MIKMVERYVNKNGKIKLIKKKIKMMEKEFKFWMNKKNVKVKKDGNE